MGFHIVDLSIISMYSYCKTSPGVTSVVEQQLIGTILCLTNRTEPVKKYHYHRFSVLGGFHQTHCAAMPFYTIFMKIDTVVVFSSGSTKVPHHCLRSYGITSLEMSLTVHRSKDYPGVVVGNDVRVAVLWLVDLLVGVLPGELLSWVNRLGGGRGRG